MKRFLPLFIVAVALSSCQEDVHFNTPGFQGRKDDVFWRANDARAYIDGGALTIVAETGFETITLNTASVNPGTYLLGPTAGNSASYFSDFNGDELEYGTIAAPGPVANINLLTAGSGYVSGSSIATTGGSGTGLTVNITVNSSGAITVMSLSSRGAGYMAGDVITIVGGNNNCKFRVLNTSNSNGEIVIEEYDTLTGTVTGTFKFNAAKSNNNPFGGPILNFQNGKFYHVPIYPSI